MRTFVTWLLNRVNVWERFVIQESIMQVYGNSSYYKDKMKLTKGKLSTNLK